MSREVSLLAPTLRALCTDHMKQLIAQGYDVRILQTWRSLEDQAKKWRCTRSTKEIREGAAHLRILGFPHFADVLEAVGPQERPAWLPHGHLTHALPGQSKHHRLNIFNGIWSCAYDIGFFDAGGHYIGDGKYPGYYLAGKIGQRLGLEWLGAPDSPFKEEAHFQLSRLPPLIERMAIVVE